MPDLQQTAAMLAALSSARKLAADVALNLAAACGAIGLTADALEAHGIVPPGDPCVHTKVAAILARVASPVEGLTRSLATLGVVKDPAAAQPDPLVTPSDAEVLDQAAEIVARSDASAQADQTIAHVQRLAATLRAAAPRLTLASMLEGS